MKTNDKELRDRIKIKTRAYEEGRKLAAALPRSTWAATGRHIVNSTTGSESIRLGVLSLICPTPSEFSERVKLD